MKEEIKKKSIPALDWIFDLGKKIKLPGLEGLSLYDVLEIYIVGIVKGALTTRAGSISYSFFMSLFPFLLFVFNLFPYFDFIDYRQDVLPVLEDLFPPHTLDAFQGTTENIFATKRGGLLSTSFFLSMFLMANGVNSLFSGFQNSYHTKINNSYLKQYITAFCVALLLAVFLFIAVISVPLIEIYIIQNLKDFGYITSDEFGMIIVKYVLIVMMFYTIISIFYNFGSPDNNKKKKFFSPGATLSTILFLLTTYLFGIYVENFAQYNQLYGSIGAILILMLYIWLNSNILLLGYELNASLRSLKFKNNQYNLNEIT
ncbi:YihY/virulence factor BrkB family protein [Pseudofulvibacter geojedonensis]|uniref:YihY/virulence factor BrkB family protein n=1 Tax=Pseudofulvibacter geojedonensis TaxID=1123758 RepID=A0ABW3HZC7_9FLAO